MALRRHPAHPRSRLRRFEAHQELGFTLALDVEDIPGFAAGMITRCFASTFKSPCSNCPPNPGEATCRGPQSFSLTPLCRFERGRLSRYPSERSLRSASVPGLSLASCGRARRTPPEAVKRGAPGAGFPAFPGSAFKS